MGNMSKRKSDEKKKYRRTKSSASSRKLIVLISHRYDSKPWPFLGKKRTVPHMCKAKNNFQRLIQKSQ